MGAGAKNPEAGAGAVFQRIIIAHMVGLRPRIFMFVDPPVAGNPLRAATAPDEMHLAPPGKGDRRIIRHRGDGGNGGGFGEQLHRPWLRRRRPAPRRGAARRGAPRRGAGGLLRYRQPPGLAFRNMRGMRCDPPEIFGPQPVEKGVDGLGIIRRWRFGAALQGRASLGSNCGQADGLNAKAGIDAVQFLDQQPADMQLIMAGCGKADQKFRALGIHPVEARHQLRHPAAGIRQPFAKLGA